MYLFPLTIGRDCVTMNGDQIFGKGVMVGGYMNPRRLNICKYLLFQETLTVLHQLWADETDLASKIDSNSSGVLIFSSSFS